MSGTGSPQRKLLILLVGGRTQPATLLALEIRPQIIAIIASRDSQTTAEAAQKRLNTLLQTVEIMPTTFVHPYRPSETRSAIQKILGEKAAAGTTSAISLTSATLPMSIGAYDVACENSCPVYYLNTGGGEVLDFNGAEEIAPLMLRTDLEDFLANESLVVSPNQKGTQAVSGMDGDGLLPLAHAFAQAPVTSANLLDWLRSGTHRASERFVPGQITKRWRDDFGQAEWKLMQTMQRHNAIDGLHRSSSEKTVTFRLPSQETAAFLKGDWLEAYVYAVAHSLHIEERPAFDSCRTGLRFLADAAEREIDFIGTWRGTALIASCKTGKDAWQKTQLDEVAAVARLLGDSYCTRLLVTNRTIPHPESKEHSAWQNAVQQARS